MAARKTGGGKRPRGRVQVSRWASLLFGALILLFIGVLTGMQIEAQRQQVSATHKPAPRIVVDQPPRIIEREAPLPEATEAVPEPKPAAIADEDFDRIETADAAVKPPEAALPPVPAVPPPAPVLDRIITPPPPPAQVIPAALTMPGAGWRKHALAAPKVDGRPMIAVVIDDLGVDRKRSDRIVALPGPLTTAFMAYAKDLPRVTAAARAKGHELMLHMPMEPQGGSYDAGPDGEVLTVGLSAAEVRRRVAEGLGRFDGMIGLNNHMGSRFTQDPAGMKAVMEELSKRGLMFLDSMTSPKSVGVDEARRHGVPALARDVFIDNEETYDAVMAQLHRTEQVARKQGNAIAIGHPHDATIDALTAWLPTLKDKGLVLVPISAILRRQYPNG